MNDFTKDPKRIREEFDEIFQRVTTPVVMIDDPQMQSLWDDREDKAWRNIFMPSYNIVYLSLRLTNNGTSI